MSTRTILVVDDDPKMRRLLRRCFEGEGFAVAEADTKAGVLAAIRNKIIDLVTLDIGLGHESGLAIARDIRKGSDVPLMMITARDDVIDRVVGLEVGADDYITKPFHVREVVARVHALLRRAQGASGPKPTVIDTGAVNGSIFRIDELRINLSSLEMHDREGRSIELTAAEVKLLQVFLSSPKRALSRDQIMDQLNGASWTPLDRTIDNQVARLRKKIERDPAHPHLIKTMRGIGYVLTTDVIKSIS